MANSIKIKLNRDTVRKLAKSDEMLTVVNHVAEKIADAAGDGFEVRAEYGKTRARASVYSKTNAARRAEAKDRALTKAPGQVTL